MSDKLIITIGRQFGSGGIDVGKKLAKHYNIDFYDKELIQEAAKESGFCEQVFEKADEVPSNSFLYSFLYSAATGAHSINSMLFQNNGLLTNDNLFSIQSKVIKKIAKEKSCIIVGRCSDYILREEKKLVRVYLHGDMDFRVQKIMKRYNINEKEAQSRITKTDKTRSSYYSYYTGNERENLTNYDICINTSKVGIDNAVEQIINFTEKIINK